MAALVLETTIPSTALSAATPRTVFGLKAPSNQAVRVSEIVVSFDGSTASAIPVTVEIGRCTFATNPIGTNSTAATPGKRDPRATETPQAAVGTTWTAGNEPTLITTFKTEFIPAYNGFVHYVIPWSSSIIVPGGGGLVIRCTAPAPVDVSGSVVYEE